MSFRRPAAHKIVDGNANALIYKEKLRNSFRRSVPIKTWAWIKQRPPTPMRTYNTILVRGCGGMAGPSPLSIVEAVRLHGWTASAAMTAHNKSASALLNVEGGLVENVDNSLRAWRHSRSLRVSHEQSPQKSLYLITTKTVQYLS